MAKTQYPNDYDQELIHAIHSLKTPKEVQNFLRDLLTIAEIREASLRFQIAKRLWLGGKSYLEIAEELHTSTSTVTRVADWLYNQGLDGYQTTLKRLFPKAKKKTIL